MKQEIRIFATRHTRELAALYSDFICNALGIEDITSCHLCNYSERLKAGSDQFTPVHKAVYSEFDKGESSKLVSEYWKLANAMAVELSVETDVLKWAFQRYPSLRVHYPGNVSVFEFHRDSDYNHPLGELNHFLALTNCTNTASLWLETNLGWGDISPLNLEQGQLARLNTSIWLHGDKINLEGYTRVSIDFRLVPLAVIEGEKVSSSITKNIKFNKHHYFKPASTINGLSVTRNAR